MAVTRKLPRGVVDWWLCIGTSWLRIQYPEALAVACGDLVGLCGCYCLQLRLPALLPNHCRIRVRVLYAKLTVRLKGKRLKSVVLA
jgi:hypothetical protein